jgi:hypothetical protein
MVANSHLALLTCWLLSSRSDSVSSSKQLLEKRVYRINETRASPSTTELLVSSSSHSLFSITFLVSVSRAFLWKSARRASWNGTVLELNAIPLPSTRQLVILREGSLNESVVLVPFKKLVGSVEVTRRTLGGAPVDFEELSVTSTKIIVGARPRTGNGFCDHRRNRPGSCNKIPSR